MDYNRIILFCDYGLDDAIATLHILKNAAKFEHIDIVPVGGNVSVDIAFRNAQTLLFAAGADKNKVRIIDTRGIDQPAANIPDVHGADGIGDLLAPATSEVPTIDFYAYKNELFENANKAHDCILSLGPCTIPAMLNYVPNTVVLMGGATEETPNYGEYEFNEGMDVAAFKSYVKNSIAVATLDSCHDTKFGFADMRFNDNLADRLLDRYIELCKNRDAFITVYDYVAALYVTDPECFELHRVRRKDGTEYNELKFIGRSK